VSRGRYYGTRRLTAADAPGLARDIQHARNRGDTQTVKRLERRAASLRTQLSMVLYGGASTKDGEREGVPFDDSIPF
jgi:hypothetical protein